MAFPTTSLMIDTYELTMVDAAVASGTAERKCVFEAFGRRFPGRRHYGMVCGIGHVFETIRDFRFNPEEVEHLASRTIVPGHAVQYLADYRFVDDVCGYIEGECYFPHSPVLMVAGLFAGCVVLETVILSVLNHDSAVAATISCIMTTTHGHPCLKFGARCMRKTATVHAARAAVIAGFTVMSDLKGGRTYDLSVAGTSVYSLTLVHDSEKEAPAAQAATMGTGTTSLVGTHNIAEGVDNAVIAACETDGKLDAVRLDSGNLVARVFTMRKQLDDLDATSTRIAITSGLDEYSVATLDATSIDSYGVRTRVVTGSGYPMAGMIYKLVQREGADGKMYEVVKSSKNGTSVNGLKVVGRVCDQRGNTAQELVVSAGSWQGGLDYLERAGACSSQIELVDAGAIDESRIGKAAVIVAATRHEESCTELPYDGRRLFSDEPVVPTKMLDIFEGDG